MNVVGTATNFTESRPVTFETTVVQLLRGDSSHNRLGQTATNKRDAEEGFEAICQQFGDAFERISNVDEPLRQPSVEQSTIDR